MEGLLVVFSREKRFLLIIFFIVIWMIVGCSSSSTQERLSTPKEGITETDKEKSPPFIEEKTPFNKELFAKGEFLYQKQCAVCHGVQGAADGKAAYLLYPKPRDFTRDKFRLVSTTNMEITDEDLFKTITRGMPGSAMPPWESLSAQDRWALVYFVRYLSEIENYKKTGEITEEMLKDKLSWESVEKIVNKKIEPENKIVIPQEPPVTLESLAKGKELFIASCAGCHGKEGRGDGQQEMKDNLGYPLKARDLTAGIFKGASSSAELYCRMIGGMPGSPMPSYLGAMTQEQIWDLIHYVQTLAVKGAEEKVRLRQMIINAQEVSGDIKLDPFSKEWSKAKPLFVSLTPLWWRNQRVEGVEVKALYNKDKIAFLLSWSDTSLDDDAVAVQSFPDGAAIQFSKDQDPPFFGMGEKDNPVYIWHWKASWQADFPERKDIETRHPNVAVDWYKSQSNYPYGAAFEVQESKTKFHDPEFTTGWGAGNPLSDPNKESASETALAAGLGSYTTQKTPAEHVQSQGTFKDGKWYVIFIRSINSSDEKDLQFKSGDVLSVAFAIWDGSGGDRNGQKMVSIWNKLILK